jgi:hypothetical protein
MKRIRAKRGRGSGRRSPDRAAILEAVPIHRPNVEARDREDGGVELRLHLEKGRLARWLTGGPGVVIRRFELDRLGAEVWRMSDGRTTVRDMIQRFTGVHRLNLREAEVSILTYLRTLTGRGILILREREPESRHGKEGES